MVNKPTIIWSIQARKDLKKLHSFYTNQSKEYAEKTINEIFSSLDKIVFVGQYQKDEVLGLPFRRLFVNNVRIVYEVLGNTLTVYRLFDTRKG